MICLLSSHQQIALLGGTFDPVHWGHLRPAIAAAEHFNWQQIELLPTCLPPHRQQPIASNEQRLAMLTAAAELHPLLQVNDWELRQGIPSRTLATLQHFRNLYPQATLYFLMGMDSLLNLPDWQHWQQLFHYCHFVVLPRPGYDIHAARPEVRALLAERQAQPAAMQSGCGRIYIADVPPFASSATAIREQLRDALENSKRNPAQPPPLLPAPVWQYICQHNLYR